MKKIAVVTINHGFNYGNKLQNYAVQRIYESLGYNATTIRFFPKGAKVIEKVHWTVPVFFKKVNRRMKLRLYAHRIQGRTEAFKEFDSRWLHFTEHCYTPDDYTTIDENQFDYFSVGSDQVWNSYFYDFCPIYLLGFVRNPDKKIALSASFGVDDVKIDYVNQFKSALPEFKAISVRESRGKDLVRELSGRNAEVILDPTLLLPCEEWELLSLPLQNQSKYVLTYFLGPIPRDLRKTISAYAKQKQCKVIHLNQLQNRFYTADPQTFLSYIKNAEMIFTDSFHACCFSLQFQKRFWVADRITEGRSMSSRLHTFLNVFGLESRLLASADGLDDPVDYVYANSVLEEKRAEGWKFVRNAINEENNP